QAAPANSSTIPIRTPSALSLPARAARRPAVPRGRFGAGAGEEHRATARVRPEEPAMAKDQLPDIDTSVPQSARIWDYWLGGKENFPADRAAGDAVLRVLPGIAVSAQQDRAFLGRAVRFLVRQGIRQFLDLGSGLPTVDNTHEVAQRVAPSSRIVYVDNDPLVQAHARALLRSTPEGACDYVEADIRDTDLIIAEASRTL